MLTVPVNRWPSTTMCTTILRWARAARRASSGRETVGCELAVPCSTRREFSAEIYQRVARQFLLAHRPGSAGISAATSVRDDCM